MTLSQEQLASIEPLRNKIGDSLESRDEYARRVGALLPNFPTDVLHQWFHDHPQVIEENAWLDFPSLRFVLSEFEVKDLALPCLAEHETVVQYRDHFLNGVESPQMDRLAQYIAAHGTWPVAPLVLDNPAGAFVAPWGLRYSKPFDLLEGHHRMAVLYALGKNNSGTHKVWLVQR